MDSNENELKEEDYLSVWINKNTTNPRKVDKSLRDLLELFKFGSGKFDKSWGFKKGKQLRNRWKKQNPDRPLQKIDESLMEQRLPLTQLDMEGTFLDIKSHKIFSRVRRALQILGFDDPELLEFVDSLESSYIEGSISLDYEEIRDVVSGTPFTVLTTFVEDAFDYFPDAEFFFSIKCRNIQTYLKNYYSGNYFHLVFGGDFLNIKKKVYSYGGLTTLQQLNPKQDFDLFYDIAEESPEIGALCFERIILDFFGAWLLEMAFIAKTYGGANNKIIPYLLSFLDKLCDKKLYEPFEGINDKRIRNAQVIRVEEIYDARIVSGSIQIFYVDLRYVFISVCGDIDIYENRDDGYLIVKNLSSFKHLKVFISFTNRILNKIHFISAPPQLEVLALPSERAIEEDITPEEFERLRRRGVQISEISRGPALKAFKRKHPLYFDYPLVTETLKLR